MFLIRTVNRAFTRFEEPWPAHSASGILCCLLSSIVDQEQEQTLPIRCPLCGARLSVVLALMKPASSWQSYTCPTCFQPSHVMFEGTIKWVGPRVDTPTTEDES